jgi:hypothetical protein
MEGHDAAPCPTGNLEHLRLALAGQALRVLRQGLDQDASPAEAFEVAGLGINDRVMGADVHEDARAFPEELLNQALLVNRGID